MGLLRYHFSSPNGDYGAARRDWGVPTRISPLSGETFA